MAARILSVATALPPHRYEQQTIADAAATVFASHPHTRALLTIFQSSGVHTRHLVRPLSFYQRAPGFAERNDVYVAEATALCELALDRALEGAGLARRDLDHLVFASTTGLATPSIDALLLHRMGLRTDLERTPIFGIGCAAGAVGLSRAADLARVREGAVIALATVELCSLTFLIGDVTPKNVVGTALFGDGAAAAILRVGPGVGPGAGPRVLAHASHTFADSVDVMGWRFGGEGLELVLSRELPALVEREVQPLVDGFLAGHGLKVRDIEHFVVHPGGPKVVDALEVAIGLAAGTLDSTRRFLGAHGNLSSASVLFLLAELLASGRAAPGERGLLLAFGPGFSAEMLLLEW